MPSCVAALNWRRAPARQSRALALASHLLLPSPPPPLVPYPWQQVRSLERLLRKVLAMEKGPAVIINNFHAWDDFVQW